MSADNFHESYEGFGKIKLGFNEDVQNCGKLAESALPL